MEQISTPPNVLIGKKKEEKAQWGFEEKKKKKEGRNSKVWCQRNLRPKLQNTTNIRTGLAGKIWALTLTKQSREETWAEDTSSTILYH